MKKRMISSFMFLLLSISIITTGYILNPSKAVGQTLIQARVFCENSLLPHDRITTFRSDANDQQLFPNITFSNALDQKINPILSPQILTSEENLAEIFFHSIINPGSDPSVTRETFRIYHSNVSTYTRENTAEAVLDIPFYTSALSSHLSNEGLHEDLIKLSNSTRWFLNPAFDLKSFELRDIATFDIVKNWSLNPIKSAIAGFSEDGRKVAFYSKTTSNQMQIVIGFTDSERMIKLPFSANGQTQISPIFSGDIVYWIERGTSKNEIKALNIVLSQKAVTISTHTNLASALQVVIGSKTDKLIFAQDQIFSFTDVDRDTLKEISTKKVNLPLDLLATTKNLSKKWPERILHLPWTKEILISLGIYGGTALYNYGSNSWKTTGITNPANRCLNPVAGPEFYSPGVTK